ncbi:coproporphyrinogen III oxidase [Bifidobacterium dolichotidis]|uniref:Heme chaperone HemW n=1 Tax=Bifidobacterium dolichotidis TaxID=2306976 RepID=A0A430FSZ7_9BIFI|nr:radical SAM family heme chaperone HemW [Bifidobacterium dolichotidis]RSX55990.1 coproporphyrinogen III oxidase [Bifidobacterium dolichotidis]
MYEVYIHVPFCLRRCGYCDFNTYTAVDLGNGASRDNYANLAIDEMRIVKQWQLDHGVDEGPASTVFLGGGTPTILKPQDLARLVQAIDDTWGIAAGAEITTEANPDTVDADYIQALADAGFTRISFGMQSAVPRVLKTLDRTHTPANVAAGIAAANAAGLRSSVDLIYGTPGETLDDWRTSVQAAIDLGVDHISAYALTVEATTKMGRQIAAGTLPKPDDDDEAAKYEIADELLTAAGLEWYEVSNWARPGQESRHNLGYWRNVDWAGIGPGAHSHYGNVNGQGLRAWDIPHPKLWAGKILDNQVPWAGSETVTPVEQAEEQLMLGLRIREGLDINTVDPRIPSTIWQQFVDEGLLDAAALEQGRAVPTRKGRLLNDAMITELMEYLG